MRFTLAAATLLRHRARTALAVLGVAVSAALLLDMVMLATGMRESFRDLFLVRDFQLRVTPKGTLPFDTEATIADASAVAAQLRADPRIARVSVALGGQLHVLGADDAPVTTAFGLGILPAVQGDYEPLSGRDLRDGPAHENELVVNDAFLARARARVGDTLDVAVGFDPQLRQASGRRRLVVVGTGRFYYTAAGQAVAALPLATMQRMRGEDGRDRASLLMAGVRPGVSEEAARRDIERAIPRVSIISTGEALRQVEERLSYFRQLALILGAISLGIGFLLVTTLVTVSVNERVGEIAVLRAIGVSKRHVVEQIVAEGAALSLTGAALGLALGVVTARYLNTILSDFPGLPASFDFFVFDASAAWRSLGLLVVAGVAAGVYPSWRAASLPVAATLREEAVG